MRFIANKSELLPAVRRCNLVIGRYFVSREMSCVMMDADERTNTVTLTAKSKNCTLQIRQPCRVEESGKALLFATTFQKMVETFADEATTIATDSSCINVQNAKSRFSFPLMDAGKYPAVTTPAPDSLLDCDGFAEISAKALFSVAQGKSAREELKCVHLMVHDGKFSAASCDGFRFTVASQAAAQDEPMDMLLTADAMKTLLAVFRGIPHCKMGMSDGNALFLAPGLVLTTQLSPYQATQLQPLLERFAPASALSVDGALLYEELMRIGVGKTTGARVVLQTEKAGMLRLSFIGGGLEKVQSQTEMAAAVHTPLPEEGFCYQYPYLAQAAKLLCGQEVEMQFDARGTLLCCTEQALHMLMPTRMPEQKNQKTKRKKAA